MSAPRSDWSLLKDVVPTRGEFRVIETGVVSAEGSALIALDSEGMRHLLLPVRAGTVIEPDERSAGVHILPRTLVEKGVPYHFVDVACRREHLVEIFSYLADEVLEGLAVEPGKPATVARRVLNRWREFLDRQRPSVLSEEELVGLFGELLVLVDLVERSPTAVEAWMGPLGARFDFQVKQTALEVKTTVNRERRVFTIHGVGQLEPPDGIELYLETIVLERTNTAELSVPSLVQRLRELGADALMLSSKLQAAGYSERDAAMYKDMRWRVVAKTLFSVESDFPRITEASFVGGRLPNRVSNLQYCIDLTAPPPEPCSAATAESVLRNLTT